MDFLDEQRMSRLYEKFILEYYKKHYPDLSPDSPRIDWQLDDDNDSMLPAMKTDIVLQKDNHFLIIDAKYYNEATQTNFDKHTIHSGNMYQIFAYVKNKEAELADEPDHSVSGLLLYAKTNEAIQPEGHYSMSGNRIDVRTLDLNQDFRLISHQLNQITNIFTAK